MNNKDLCNLCGGARENYITQEDGAGRYETCSSCDGTGFETFRNYASAKQSAMNAANSMRLAIEALEGVFGK